MGEVDDVERPVVTLKLASSPRRVGEHPETFCGEQSIAGVLRGGFRWQLVAWSRSTHWLTIPAFDPAERRTFLKQHQYFRDAIVQWPNAARITWLSELAASF
ncbi:hypothetical protein ACFL2H_08135 [Planctomycetota bacterium]